MLPIYDLLEKYRCHISFFPAVWPETFVIYIVDRDESQFVILSRSISEQFRKRLKELQWGELLPLELINRQISSTIDCLHLKATSTNGPHP